MSFCNITREVRGAWLKGAPNAPQQNMVTQISFLPKIVSNDARNALVSYMDDEPQHRIWYISIFVEVFAMYNKKIVISKDS